MPPKLKCPDNISTSTDLGVSYATVSWTVPEPQDNSNQSVLLWSDPATDLPVKLQFGNTYISYVATDSSYNQALCEFSITVIDSEPPTVEDCESPPALFRTVTSNETVLWAEPRFSDNSMKEPFVNVSHSLEELPIGTTEVVFTAFDSSGNSNFCIINYTLIDDGCKELPAHVRANCSEDFCTLSCEEGFMFVSANATIDVPYPCAQSTLPECSDTEEPNYIVQEGTLTLTPTSADLCNDTNFLSQVKSSVRQSLSEVCNGTSERCSVGVEAECEDVIGAVEEESNQVIGRRRRSIPQGNIKVDFKLTGKLEEKTIQDQLSSMDTTFFQTIPKKKTSKLYLKPPNIVCPAGTVYRRSRCVKCPAGTYWKEKRRECIPCSFGTYQPLPSQLQCLPCPHNTSTRKLHAKHAHACRDICPAGTYGSRRGRHGVGRLGVKPCLSCLVGWYQPKPGALSCVRCDNNMTTSRRRTVHSEDCHADPPPCQLSSCLNNGTCVVKDNHVTCKCLSGYVGSRCEFRKDECQSMPCLHGGTCTNVEGGHVCLCADGFSGKDCQIDVDECASNPCQNGGECTDLIASFVCHCPSAFQGDVCEVNVDECFAEPCAEGSSCVDQVGDYSCVCREGYSGRHCELDPCLNTTLCQHGGVCYLGDTTQPSYWCECEPRFSGPHCETEVDLCASSPCQHNGTCHNLLQPFQVQCQCRPGYVGKYCETYMPSNFTLFFPTSGTSNYVKVKGPYSNMTEVSVCLWMQTQDHFNYGTIFSYATSIHDNTLTLTDYNGLVLYVNGHRVVTDVTANDGVWHHICIEWASNEGQWMLYKDGLLKDGGIGLANNTHVPGGGILVLGQDQDQIGGGFNAAESLVGYLTQVNLWNYNLGAEKINHLASHCLDQEEGNVINWGQLRSGVQGKVLVGPSTLCQGCKILSSLPFTHVELSDSGDVATYTCDLGYSFKYFSSSEVTKVDRKCLVHGDWEGKSPVCTKRSCGFPGYFPAGWVVGRSYLYQNQIEYVCKSGYRLVGDRIRTCLGNGTWSGETPSCQGGECPDVYMPEHGMMWGTLDDVYRLEFECKPGYELHGSEVLTCHPNKTWSHEPPVCLPISCNFITNLTVAEVVVGPGLVEEGSYHLATQVQVSCAEGYRSEHAQYHTTCTNTGWSPPLHDLGCVLLVCPQLELTNGTTVADSFTPGSKLTVKCDTGFTLNGSAELMCLPSGEWNSTSSCEIVTCPEIVTKHLTLPRSKYSKIATIQCPAGMILLSGGHPVQEQEVRWECGEDGQWRNLTEAPVNPHILDCVSRAPTVCSQPEGPQFGYVVPDIHNSSSYEEGYKLQVQCRQGYTRQGNDFTACKHDGSWTNDTLCQAVDCGEPPQLPFTQLALVSSTLYGSLVKLKCHDGYQAYGDMSMRCQTNKKWSRFRGRCVRISCGKPRLDEGIAFIGNAYLFQEKLKIMCPAGYSLDGDEFITCEKDGKWSSTPKCFQL